MRSHHPLTPGSLCILLALALPASALAQDPSDQGFNAQNFKPATGTKDLVITQSAEVSGDLVVGGGFLLHYAKVPAILAFRDANGDLKQSPNGVIVDNAVTGDVYASLGLLDKLEIGVALPVGFFQDGNGLGTGATDELAATGLGDVRLNFKLLLGRVRPLGLSFAFAPRLTFPSGNKDDFRGDGFVTFSPSLIATRTGGRYRVSVEAGMTFREQHIVRNLDVGTQILYRAGMGYQVTPGEIEIIGELYGASTAATLFQDESPFKGADDEEGDESPLEGLLAAKFRLVEDLHVLIGGAAGLIHGYGTPRFRLFGGVSWAPGDTDRDGDGIFDSEDACPDDPEDKDDFEDSDGCPDPDNDEDGILDVRDRCPNEPEDMDGFQDDDGCPELDNDLDRIPDHRDKCPNDKEDPDGFEDLDGCPDPDNDKDGILDGADRCPLEPEDIDNFEDGDGCPDLDNDNDKIPDTSDKCPNKPETYNGVDDEDGCPDPSRVIVLPGEIKILEKIFFDHNSDTIKEKSFDLLDEVAATFEANPQIKRVRIDGHTDSNGPRNYNLGLSQRRATSVLRYLTSRGVSPDRLIAQGFGEDRPIDTNETLGGRANNRRVEFIIVEEN
jgi:outer membrane protein OmpA-like peptidoglycan-associated protein